MKPDIREYVGEAQRLVALCVAGKHAEALSQTDRLHATFDRLEVSLGALGERIETDAVASVDRSEAVSSLAIGSVVAALIVGCIVSLLFGASVAKSIVLPLNALASVLHSGDLHKLSTIRSADEFGRMAKAVAATLKRVNDGAEQLAQQKAVIEANSAELQQAMEESRASAEQLAQQNAVIEANSAELRRAMQASKASAEELAKQKTAVEAKSAQLQRAMEESKASAEQLAQQNALIEANSAELRRAMEESQASAEKLAKQNALIEANAAELQRAMEESRLAAAEAKRLASEAARVASMVENTPAAMMFADESLTFRYLNPAARESLTVLSASGEPGFDVREGTPLDAMYAHPAGNAEFFSRAENLPHRARRQIGSETVDLVFSAIFDDQHERLGTLVSWEIITEQLAANARAEASAAEADRVASMVANAPGCMMYADSEYVLRYLNPAASSAAAKLGLEAEQLVGADLADFYAHPAGNPRFFGVDSNLPWSKLIELRGESVQLSCSAIRDAHGARLGLLISWEIVTDRLRAERASQEASERELRQAQELQAKVERMLVAVDAASRGDLTQEVDVSGEDAIGRMGDAIARLLGDFRKSIGRIRSNAEKLAHSSEQLTGVSQRMSSEAEQTSTQVSVVADAASNVEASMRTASQNTEAMTDSIAEIARSASSAAKVARTAVDTAESTNETVADLDRSSEEIGKILKTITAIAQQTNLLALNATIEAARAGEMGKGFAVVANEVKELAKETAKATTDIGAKIEAMQSGSRGAVSAISRIGGIIREIDGLQTTIAAAVEQQTASTKEITMTLAGAASASTAIHQNMSQVATTARETSSDAANSLDVASGVARMADELLELVGQFRC